MLWKIKKWELIDYIGKVLLPTEYDSLDYNRLVLPFEYDDIRFDIEEWCATGYEYIRYIYVRKDKRYYKYDRETPIMEVML